MNVTFDHLPLPCDAKCQDQDCGHSYKAGEYAIAVLHDGAAVGYKCIYCRDKLKLQNEPDANG